MTRLDPSLAPHPEHAAFARRMAKLAADAGAAGRWSGVLFRSAEPVYAAREDRLDGVGGRLNGGRWNPAGLACVYGSTTPEGAMAETLATQRHYGLPAESAMPRTFFAFEATLYRVLDLTDGTVRRRLDVALRDLLACDWRGDRAAGREALTQAVGRAAADAGFAALIVPSAAEAGVVNLAVYPPAFGTRDRLAALAADKLRPAD